MCSDTIGRGAVLCTPLSLARQRRARSDAPYQSRYTCPLIIDQLTGASHAMICSKTSVEPDGGRAIRSARKPGRIWPSAFSNRNARAGFTVANVKISFGGIFGKFF